MDYMLFSIKMKTFHSSPAHKSKTFFISMQNDDVISRREDNYSSPARSGNNNVKCPEGKY